MLSVAVAITRLPGSPSPKTSLWLILFGVLFFMLFIFVDIVFHFLVICFSFFGDVFDFWDSAQKQMRSVHFEKDGLGVDKCSRTDLRSDLLSMYG